MTDDVVLVIPETDVLGMPTAASEFVRSHWAVLIDASMQGIPGPHLLDSQDEASARRRLAAWREEPNANPRLVRRKIVETFGEWELAQ